MTRGKLSRWIAAAALIASPAGWAQAPAGPAQPAAAAAQSQPDTGQKPPGSPEASDSSRASQRTQLNLRGSTETSLGESRRNENVQFNPIDNNLLRDMNVRIGASATIIGEFEPQAKYFSAEYGIRPEQPVQPISAMRLGVHGTAWATHENSVLNARSFFQVGDVKPAHENNYSLTLSLPQWRKWGLTLDGEQQKVRGSVNGNVLVPNANERTPLTTDPRLRPLVEKLLAFYPSEAPNKPDIDDRALNTNSPQQIDTNRVSALIDRNVTEKNRVAWRYAGASQKVRSFQFVTGQNYDSRIYSNNARITWTRTSSGSVFTAYAAFDRVQTQLRRDPRMSGPSASAFVITSVGGSNNPLDRAVNDFQYAAHFSRTRGNHALTMGAGAIRRQFNSTEYSGHFGSFLFADAFGRDAVTNMRMGTPIKYTVTIGDTQRGFRNTMLAFYIGDKWRASPKLTLSFAIRFEPVTSPHEVNNLDPLPFGCDCNNVAPSFGAAYRAGGAWGVVRAAYGIHYSQLFPATYGQQRFNPPRNLSLSVDEPDMSDPLKDIDLRALSPDTRSALIAISPDLALPYSQQYNFSWEPDVSRRFRLQFGYVGSRTWKLFSSWTMNRAVPVANIPRTLATVNDRRPDPAHYMITRVMNGSRAYYDAARATIVIPATHGLSFDASYWFSKAIDLNSNYSATGVGSIPPPQADVMVKEDFRGVSDFHQPHAALVRGSFETARANPGRNLMLRAFANLTFSGVLLVKSGTPFTVFAGSDAPGIGNVDGESGDRVDVVDPRVLGRTIGNPDTSTAMLPRAAFAFMSRTALRGNAGRNVFRKGKIANVNAAVARSWALSSSAALSIRAESVNLLNTPQFAEPERNVASKLFARISNTLNLGRAFRFTARLTF